MLYLLFLYIAVARPHPDLHLALVPQISPYILGKPQSVSVAIENRGNAPAEIDNRFLLEADESHGGEIVLLITGPNEEPVPFSALFMPAPLPTGNIVKLSAGQSLAHAVSLDRFYPITSPGEYVIQAIYDTRDLTASAPFWKGKLVSDPASVQFESPAKTK